MRSASPHLQCFLSCVFLFLLFSLFFVLRFRIIKIKYGTLLRAESEDRIQWTEQIKTLTKNQLYKRSKYLPSKWPSHKANSYRRGRQPWENFFPTVNLRLIQFTYFGCPVLVKISSVNTGDNLDLLLSFGQKISVFCYLIIWCPGLGPPTLSPHL